MANNFPAFKDELFNLLVATTNIDATTKQKIRDRFVAAYPSDWAAFLIQQGGGDTAANRGKFLVAITFDSYWKSIWTNQSVRENVATNPPDPWT